MTVKLMAANAEYLDTTVRAGNYLVSAYDSFFASHKKDRNDLASN